MKSVLLENKFQQRNIMILVGNYLFTILLLHWTSLIVWGTYVQDVSKIGSALVPKSFVSIVTIFFQINGDVWNQTRDLLNTE
jgi:membrane-bound acyltransferase YfiQ involved in biofilm formation